MKRTTWLIAGLLIVVLVSVTTVAGPVRNAGKLLDRLWGSNITAGELLQLTCPDALARLPQGAWNTKVIWGPKDGGGVTIGVQYTAKKTATIQNTTPSSGKGKTSATIPITVWIDYTSKISASGRNVYCGASNTVIFPPFLRMQYMSVEAILRGSDGTYESTWDDEYDVWRVTTNNTADVGGNADYWTVGYHVVEASNANPPYIFVVTRSRTIWGP